jgi:hypothetical protein
MQSRLTWSEMHGTPRFRVGVTAGSQRRQLRPNEWNYPAGRPAAPRARIFSGGAIYYVTPSVPKYLHLLTSALHTWPFVLFKKIVKILFTLLWHVLSSYVFQVYHNYFYIFTNFLNETNGQIWSAEVKRCKYFGTEGVCTDWYMIYLIAAPRIDGRHVYSIAPSRAVPPVCGATNEGLGWRAWLRPQLWRKAAHVIKCDQQQARVFPPEVVVMSTGRLFECMCGAPEGMLRGRVKFLLPPCFKL